MRDVASLLPSPRERSEWRGGVGGGARRLLGARGIRALLQIRSKGSPSTPSAPVMRRWPTLPATKPGPARVSQTTMRKSGKPDLRGREGRDRTSVHGSHGFGAIAVCMAALLAMAPPVHAQDSVAAFYQGRQVNLIV